MESVSDWKKRLKNLLLETELISDSHAEVYSNQRLWSNVIREMNSIQPFTKFFKNILLQ